MTAYFADGEMDTAPTYLAYFDGTGSSVLHFSDMDCHAYELTLDAAELPVGYTPSGLVVPSGSDLLLVDPQQGSVQPLASNVQEIDSNRHLVLANGQLGAFDHDWHLVSWVGDGVQRFFPAFGAIYFEDADGISRLTISNATPTPSVVVTSIATDACNLVPLPAATHLELLAYYSPCATSTLTVWDAETERATPLDLPADPGALKVVADKNAAGVVAEHPNLADGAYWAIYLTDIDASTGTGSLVVRTPDGTELAIGDGAALERTELTTAGPSGPYTGGFALLDATSGLGRFVHWDATGNVSDVASNVIRQPASPTWTRLAIAVDDTRADLAEVVDGQAQVVAHNVWRARYAYAASHPVSEFVGKMAWLENVEGTDGTLSLAAPDPNAASIDDERFERLYTSVAVAHGVHVSRNSFMVDLPGLVYLTHYDATTGTGQLEYSNQELEFSSIVSQGVADYLQPGSGLLYSVPEGAGAGIWLARAK